MRKEQHDDLVLAAVMGFFGIATVVVSLLFGGTYTTVTSAIFWVLVTLTFAPVVWLCVRFVRRWKHRSR